MKQASSSRYLYVWLGLLGLTGISWGLSYAHLGGVDIGLSLVIAAMKATLVGVFFMDALEARLSAMAMPIAGGLLLILLVGLVALDVATRRTFPRAPLLPVEAPALRPASGG